LTRTLGIEVASRLTILVFTLLALFFLYRDGPGVMEEARAIAGRLFGRPEGSLARMPSRRCAAPSTGLF